MTTGVAIAAGVVGALLWGLRRLFQGCWIDSRCPAADRDLTGNVALVTGANQGLGKAIAIELARLGASVVLACRSQERAEAAAEEIITLTGNRNVTIVVLDLSSQASIRVAAEDIQRRYTTLDFLVLNAGITDGDPGLVWQSNYLGHFELVALLTPLMEATVRQAGGARIVAVSSGACAWSTIDFEDPFAAKESGPVGPYGQSKLAQVMHAKSLAQQFSQRGLGDKLVAVSCTPGAMRTSMSNGTGLAAWLLWPLVLLLWRSPRMGAQVVKMCCLGPVASGSYYSNCAEEPTSGMDNIANDAAAQERLWALSGWQVQEGRFA